MLDREFETFCSPIPADRCRKFARQTSLDKLSSYWICFCLTRVGPVKLIPLRDKMSLLVEVACCFLSLIKRFSNVGAKGDEVTSSFDAIVPQLTQLRLARAQRSTLSLYYRLLVGQDPTA